MLKRFLIIAILILCTPAFAYDEYVNCKRGKCGVVQKLENRRASILIPYQYDEITKTGKRHGDYFLKKNGKIGVAFVCDKDSTQILIPVEYDKITPVNLLNFIAEKNGKKYFYSTITGDFLPFEIDFVKSLFLYVDNDDSLEEAENEHTYGYIVKDANGKQGIVNLSNMVVLPFKYNEIEALSHELNVIIKADGKYGVINDTFGEAALGIEPVYDKIKVNSYWKYDKSVPYSYKVLKNNEGWKVLKYNGKSVQ